MSIIEKALELIKGLEFVELATADKAGKPNSAPKFFLKTNGKIVYLIDYSIGKTAENLKENSKVSLSFLDTIGISFLKRDIGIEWQGTS